MNEREIHENLLREINSGEQNVVKFKHHTGKYRYEFFNNSNSLRFEPVEYVQTTTIRAISRGRFYVEIELSTSVPPNGNMFRHWFYITSSTKNELTDTLHKAQREANHYMSVTGSRKW